ncbi:MAG: hypothetical protein DDT21_02044 [Syntrophomonadaceae bacterium]|nr:hypothetical protein [Bacillota bacterium]
MHQMEIFTIGHSNHSMESFISLIKKYAVQVVVDVRSYPYSKYVAQFNANHLEQKLALAGIKYLFMGKELGGLPDGDQFYDQDGHVLYSSIAQTTAFQQGISRLEAELEKFRMAIMCSEEDPVACHRRLLVARILEEHNIRVNHIRAGEHVQSEASLRQPEQQMELFKSQEVDEWKSTRSVLRKKQRRSASSL